MSNEFKNGDMIDVMLTGDGTVVCTATYIGESKHGRIIAELGNGELKSYNKLDFDFKKSPLKPTPINIPQEIWDFIDDEYVAVVLSKHSGFILLLNYDIYKDYVKGREFSDFYDDLRMFADVIRLPLKINTDGVIPETSLTLRPEK